MFDKNDDKHGVLNLDQMLDGDMQCDEFEDKIIDEHDEVLQKFIEILLD